MKISAVISSDIIKKDGLLKDKILFLNFVIIAVAIVTGTVLYLITENNLTGKIWNYFIRFSIDFTSKTTVEIFSGLLISHLPYMFLMIIFGTSAVGSYFISLLSFFKASGLGMLSAYLYSSFGLKGVEYALLIFFPGKFIVILSMLLLMHTCINNSIYVRGLTRGESRYENSSALYIAKVITAVLMFVLSSLVECLLIISFSSLFSF